MSLRGSPCHHAAIWYHLRVMLFDLQVLLKLMYILLQGIGPFSASGNFSSENGSKNSSSDYNADTKELIIHGAQIIGWVCTPIPHFPAFDA